MTIAHSQTRLAQGLGEETYRGVVWVERGYVTQRRNVARRHRWQWSYAIWSSFNQILTWRRRPR